MLFIIPIQKNFHFPQTNRIIVVILREIPQYISDKYVRKLFADTKQDLDLPTGKQSSFPNVFSNAEPTGPTAKDLLKELRSLGFKDTKICLEAMRKKGNDIDKIIEYLINMEENVAEKDESKQNPINDANPKMEMEEQIPSETFPNIHSYSIPPEDDYNPWSSLPEEYHKDNFVSGDSDPFSKRKVKDK